MGKQVRDQSGRDKEIRAWGIRRREVDIHQLALAYYLLARIRIDEQRRSQSEGEAATRDARASEAA